MNTKQPLLAVLIATAFATLCLPTGRLFAQFEENGDDELQVVLNYGEGSNEKYLATHRGVAEPMSLRPEQWSPFTLQFPIARAGSIVRIACLDGGQLSTGTSQGQIVLSGTASDPSLYVSANGTMSFYFQAGLTVGLYRVAVQLPEKRYYLHFYLVDPSRPRTGIAGAVLP